MLNNITVTIIEKLLLISITVVKDEHTGALIGWGSKMFLLVLFSEVNCDNKAALQSCVQKDQKDQTQVNSSGCCLLSLWQTINGKICQRGQKLSGSRVIPTGLQTKHVQLIQRISGFNEI